MKRFLLRTCAVLVVLFLIVVAMAKIPINPSHTEPYLRDGLEQGASDEGELLHRVVLFGDAGASSLDPMQASLSKVIERAKPVADRSTILALGDNIYYRGYPVKDEGQAEFNAEQQALIDHLRAQLETAKRSGTQLYLVPGNHDWYAGSVDDQAAFVDDYSAEHGIDAVLKPFVQGDVPIPEGVSRLGNGLVFLDSQWLLKADEKQLALAMVQLDELLTQLQQRNPTQPIVVAAHHPMRTEGPHNGYYTTAMYAAVIKVLMAFAIDEQDAFQPRYVNLIDKLNTVFARHQGVIFTAGHEHSLQLFEGSADKGVWLHLGSGAANTSKLSGVWHAEDSLFALQQEGFMELDFYADRVIVRAFDINTEQPRLELSFANPLAISERVAEQKSITDAEVMPELLSE